MVLNSGEKIFYSRSFKFSVTEMIFLKWISAIPAKCVSVDDEATQAKPQCIE